MPTTHQPSRSLFEFGSSSSVGAVLIKKEGRSPDVVAFDAEVVRFFVDAASLLGVPKSLAAIYGICFASEKPIAFSEISERLALSAGSISQGLRILKEVGALRTVSSATDRRVRFAPDLELRKLAARWIEERLDKQLTAGSTRLEALKRACPDRIPDFSAVWNERINQLQVWHDKGRALLPIVRAYLQLA